MQPAMTSGSRWILSVIVVLALAGVAVSSISLYHHYDKSESSFCDFGGKFNCDIVNRSIYSTVFGVPVALIGILGYILLIALAQLRRRNKINGKSLLLASFGGLGFALYLTYIEGFVLAEWCVLCLSSLVLIFFITVLSAAVAVRSNQSI